VGVQLGLADGAVQISLVSAKRLTEVAVGATSYPEAGRQDTRSDRLRLMNVEYGAESVEGLGGAPVSTYCTPITLFGVRVESF
jgi:hypothetical protein